MWLIRAAFVAVTIATWRNALAMKCYEYQSPSTGEAIQPGWAATASSKAKPGDNQTDPFFMCYSGMATYNFASGQQLGFSVFGGVPSGDQQWFNGVGGAHGHVPFKR